MILEEKPGAADSKKDRLRHTKYEYKARQCRGDETIRKWIYGKESLSKRELRALEASTSDTFQDGVHYSLKKRRRWETYLSPTKVLDLKVNENAKYPALAAKIECGDWEVFCRELALKAPQGSMKHVRTKSGKGADLCCLYDNLTLGNKKKLKPTRTWKRSPFSDYESQPSIMYSIEVNHPSDVIYQRSAYRPKKFNYYSWGKPENTHRANLAIIHDESNEGEEIEAYDDDGEEPETFRVKPMTLNDCFVVKPRKNRKRKSSDAEFEKIDIEEYEQCEFIKAKPVSPEVVRPLKAAKLPFLIDKQLLSWQTYTTEYPCSFKTIDISKFNHQTNLYDSIWLQKDRTDCLLVIPPVGDAKYGNFDSFVRLKIFGDTNRQLSYTNLANFKITVGLMYGRLDTFPHKTNAIDQIKEVIARVWSVRCTYFRKLLKVRPTSLKVDYALSDFDMLITFQDKSLTSYTSEKYPEPTCKTCNSHDSTELECGHRYCSSCASKDLQRQIYSNIDVFACQYCHSPMNPYFVFCSAPMPLLQAFLRSKFFSPSLNVRCPACNYFFKKPPNSTTIKCLRCPSIFCPSCQQPPHYPLTCDQMTTWSTQVLHESWPKKRNQRHCFCNAKLNPIPYEETSHKIKCKNCKKEFYAIMVKDRVRKLCFGANPPREVDNEDRTCDLVASEYASIAMNAYFKRTKLGYQSVMIEKIISKTRMSASEARNLILDALHFIEYGTIWLYFNRNRKPEPYIEVKDDLNLIRLCVCDIEDETFTANRIQDFQNLNAKLLVAFQPKA